MERAQLQDIQMSGFTQAKHLNAGTILGKICPKTALEQKLPTFNLWGRDHKQKTLMIPPGMGPERIKTPSESQTQPVGKIVWHGCCYT
jgi:hypothetical protein